MIKERPSSSPSLGRSIAQFLETWGGLTALVLLVAFCAFNPNDAVRQSFTNPENIRNILNQYSFVGLIAVGMTLVIIAGGIDLSVGSMLALVGGLSIMAMNKVIEAADNEVLGIVTACAVAPLLGTLLGWFNGILITKGRIAPFIVTLGGLAGYRSIIVALADGGEIRSASFEMFESLASPRNGLPVPGLMVGESVPGAGDGRTLCITYPIIAFFTIAIAAQVLLSRTRLGRHTIAVGANERAARYSAINVDRVRIFTYTFIGFCTGVAAVFLASRMNSISSASAGNLYELDAIAAVVIGGTRMNGGKGRIWGTVVGVLMLGLIDNLLQLGDVSVYWQGLVKAGVIIAAVLLQRSGAETH